MTRDVQFRIKDLSYFIELARDRGFPETIRLSPDDFAALLLVHPAPHILRLGPTQFVCADSSQPMSF